MGNLGNKLNDLKTDKARVKLCLFIIENGLKHPKNFNALMAGFEAVGYLGSLLERYGLKDAKDIKLSEILCK